MGALARAARLCGNGQTAVNKELQVLHGKWTSQVGDPLQAMVGGAPLQDARALKQRYERLRQEAEHQAATNLKLQQKVRAANEGTNGSLEAQQRLQAGEQKLAELTRAVGVLGKEAAASMVAVEGLQQRLTLQRLIAMVEAEQSYHQNCAEALERVHTQMVAERQRSESTSSSTSGWSTPQAHNATEGGAPPLPKREDDPRESASFSTNAAKKGSYYLAEVMHDFRGEGEGELSLARGNLLVVRQVSPTGWAEGEANGQAGWFPAAYVEQRHRVPASKLVPLDSVQSP
eukprot:TRINITY_DN3513_c0_g1_i1.p1 TRINITY_DN3513_c0_g1~~TRINITY_DN3513_c0_g1_i1.p1  ORF type:complete len:320 (+),score=72.28 TRINITY_DN3513_c0_g1_i1:97-960(+)